MVKKFKPNMMTTVIFTMLELFPPFSIGAPLMALIMASEKYTATDLLSLFFGIWLASVALAMFFCLLNFLTYPFTKHTVFLYERHFSRGTTEVKYRDVAFIEFDSGVLRRYGGNEPCCLNCYAQNNDLLISIKHPSLLMTLSLIRRCKTAKLRYKRIKQLVFWWGFVLVLCIVLGICGACGVEF